MKILKRNNVHQLGNPDGPVLLFAHGFGCNQKMWNRITPAFDASYRQILFDYVGSGQSDVSAFNIERYGNLNGCFVSKICGRVAAQEACQARDTRRAQ